MTGIRIAGTGGYLPGPPIDQDGVREFLRRYPDGLSLSAQERLLRSTGIETRHFAIDLADESRRETNTSMATAAARRALEAAGWEPEEVDLLVVTTVMPDQFMPPTSTLVQEALGIARCAEIEISGNCSAPYKGLLFAANGLCVGQYRRALVCSSQYASFLGWPPWMNPERMGEHQGHLRWTLSDGAAALAIERGEPDINLRVWLESSGCGRPSGMTLALGAARPDFLGTIERGDHHVTKNARSVLREVIPLVVDGLDRMLRTLEIPGDSIDHFIPAVTSLPIARKLQTMFHERCGVRPECWRMNMARVGYLGGVTCPFVLNEMVQAGSLSPGQLVCSVAEESSKWISAGAVFHWNP